MVVVADTSPINYLVLVRQVDLPHSPTATHAALKFSRSTRGIVVSNPDRKNSRS